MSYFNRIVSFILKNQSAIESLVMFLGILFTGWQTWNLHNQSKKENRELYDLSNLEQYKTFLNQQLFEIQRLCFQHPHVDNPDYTEQWNDLKKKYKNNELDGRGLDDFLKYDVYTEMIYNYIESSLKVYKTEEELLEYVNFKMWVRNHAQNWSNPLEEHSNRDVYGDAMCDMIDRWIR